MSVWWYQDTAEATRPEQRKFRNYEFPNCPFRGSNPGPSTLTKNVSNNQNEATTCKTYIGIFNDRISYFFIIIPLQSTVSTLSEKG
uniref:Uncharacterized protein n=1 Tax=Pararge aegeria TaxID=116150 RepID=S4NHW2_9NEOP